MSLSYRKTRDGEWVVFGPKAEMWDGLYNKPAGNVVVTKKDGTKKTESIDHLGKPFQADGVECCYGYIDRSASDRTATVRASRAYGTDMAEYGSGFGRDEHCAFGGTR
jgi:hypothetical protein